METHSSCLRRASVASLAFASVADARLQASRTIAQSSDEVEVKCSRTEILNRRVPVKERRRKIPIILMRSCCPPSFSDQMRPAHGGCTTVSSSPRRKGVTSRLGRWDRNRRLRALRTLETGLPPRRSLLRSRMCLVCNERTRGIPREVEKSPGTKIRFAVNLQVG